MHFTHLNVLAAFVKLLNEMRVGKMSDESVAMLASLDRPLDLPPGMSPTELYVARRHFV